MDYNRTNSMRDSRSHRRWPVSMRPLVVILLSVCLGLAGSAVHPSRLYSQSTAQATFARTAAAAIAHGKRSEAEQLATSRGAADPDAVVVLAQLGIERGKYREAQAQLEPVAARDATGEAALQLALLYKRIGRSGDAEPLLDRHPQTRRGFDGSRRVVQGGSRRPVAQSGARRQRPLSRRRTCRR